jgi:hypothetical protein
MAESGGEDTAFLSAVLSRGGKASWCEDAIAYEHLPTDRLSLRYQLTRARSYGLTMGRLHGDRSLTAMLRHSARMMAGLGLIAFPALGVPSLMIGIHLLGVGIGYFAGLRGARSDLYARVARN